MRRTLRNFSLLGILLSFASAAPATAQIKVTQGGGAPPRDGSTWDHAYGAGDLAAMLSDFVAKDKPNGGGELWIATGVYGPNIHPHRGTVLLCGFQGNETKREQRDPHANTVVFDHLWFSAYKVQVDDDNSYVEHLDATTQVDGCQLSSGVIVDGTARDPMSNGKGPLIQNSLIIGGSVAGGVIVEDGVITLDHDTIISNPSVGVTVGGLNADVDITHCQIDHNNEAGVHVAAGATLRMSDSNITDNGLDAGKRVPFYAFSGVAIDEAASVHIERCDISRNFAVAGAGMQIMTAQHAEAAILVEHSTITHNGDGAGKDDAPQPPIAGGGVYASAEQAVAAGAITFNDCTISDNVAEGVASPQGPGADTIGRGGGFYILGEGVAINRCVITRNTSRLTSHPENGIGGGVYVHPGADRGSFDNGPFVTSIRDSTIVFNFATGPGGGVYLDGSDPHLVGCTIANNAAHDAVYSYRSNYVGPAYPPPVANQRVARFDNCALVGSDEVLHHATDTQFNDPLAAPPPVFHNCAADGVFVVESSDEGPGAIPIPDSVFAVPSNPGFADPVDGDYHLGPTSPLRDRGDDAAVQPEEKDLDGNPRIAGSSVDVGAYESGAAPESIVITLTNGTAKLGSKSVKVTANLTNVGTASAAQFKVTTVAAAGPYRIVKAKVTMPDHTGQLAPGGVARLEVTIALEDGLTGCVTDLTAEGTFVDPGGTPGNFEDTQRGIAAMTVPKIVKLTATPKKLVPPNGLIDTVTFFVDAADRCGVLTNTFDVTAGAKDPITEGVDWSAPNDIQLLLRKLLAPGGKTRTYTVGVTVTNQFGRSARKTIKVKVPKPPRVHV